MANLPILAVPVKTGAFDIYHILKEFIKIEKKHLTNFSGFDSLCPPWTKPGI
jgi:hypothetical protein